MHVKNILEQSCTPPGPVLTLYNSRELSYRNKNLRGGRVLFPNQIIFTFKLLFKRRFSISPVCQIIQAFIQVAAPRNAVALDRGHLTPMMNITKNIRKITIKKEENDKEQTTNI